MNKGNTKNNVRLSVSVPWLVHEQLLVHVKQGQVSDFVAKAVQEKISEVVGKKFRKTNPWDDFLALRKTLPKFSYRQIRAAIVKGRM